MIFFRIKLFLSKEMNAEKVKIKKALLDWFIKWEEVDTGVDDLKKTGNIFRKIQFYNIYSILRAMILSGI